MAEGPTPVPRSLPSLLHNWVSLVGILLAASSGFAVVCLVAIDLFRGFANPYVGILTYVVAPGFLVSALVLIAAGAAWERRRRRRRAPGLVPAYPRIDLNVARQRHALLAVAVTTLGFLLLTALGSYRTYQFTESVAFCGTTCHAIMTPEFTAYHESPHARVACVQCHIGPGATWFVKSKLSGAYQVVATLAGTYPRPIPAPIENLRPARDTCEQCHWPREFLGNVERVRHHYLSDGRNSPWTIRLLVKIGGGDPSFGPVGGIHWHMFLANRIEYIATDRGRQVIPWVRMTDEQGRVTVFQAKDGRLTPAQVAATSPRVMDCVDCHNRPTHIYRAPVDAVDLALSTDRIDRSIPFIKREAVRALTSAYATKETGLRGIATTLARAYRTEHAAFAERHAATLARAIAEVQTIYRQNFFPAMKVDWRAYPDNAGHRDFAGCFRCHDGAHVSADGRTIRHACDTCHTIVAQGPDGRVETRLAGLPFKHPVDVAGMWRTVGCSQCHDGATVQ